MREAKFVRPLSVAMPEDLYRRIKEVTDEKRISMAEWIRDVSEKVLSNSNEQEGVNHDQQTFINQ